MNNLVKQELEETKNKCAEIEKNRRARKTRK